MFYAKYQHSAVKYENACTILQTRLKSHTISNKVETAWLFEKMAESVGFEPTCPFGQLHFECSSLQPLRYASVYKYSLLGTNHMISSHFPLMTFGGN